MTKSILAILGWVTLEIGIASLGFVHIRLWVADTVSCKGAPFILGSNQIKGIFNQVSTDNVHSWPQPWKSMYYRFFCGNLSNSDDLYDSEDYDTDYEEEDSFEALCRFESQNTPRLSTQLPMRMWKVTKKEEGIPDLVSDENGNLPPAAQVECLQSSENQEHSDNGGGELSVFTNLASESDGQAAEAGLPACNLKVSTSPTPQVGKLTPYPFVSCRVTPSGEAIFNLQ